MVWVVNLHSETFEQSWMVYFTQPSPPSLRRGESSALTPRYLPHPHDSTMWGLSQENNGGAEWKGLFLRWEHGCSQHYGTTALHCGKASTCFLVVKSADNKRPVCHLWRTPCSQTKCWLCSASVVWVEGNPHIICVIWCLDLIAEVIHLLISFKSSDFWLYRQTSQGRVVIIYLAFRELRSELHLKTVFAELIIMCN